MFQRTPNFACPMNQVFLTKEEQAKLVDQLADRFAERNNFYNGFLYQWRDNLTFDHTDEEREEFYNMLWKMVRRDFPRDDSCPDLPVLSSSSILMILANLPSFRLFL
jgi:hypothetical protein